VEPVKLISSAIPVLKYNKIIKFHNQTEMASVKHNEIAATSTNHKTEVSPHNLTQELHIRRHVMTAVQ